MTRRLHYVMVGSGRPVVILHGGKLDHRHMVDAIEPSFADLEGWSRIYVDLPGCGGSSGFEHVRSQDDALSVVAEFTAEIGAGRSVALIGESRGSYIAQGLAYTRPELVSGLALIVPGGISANGKVPAPVTLIRSAGPLHGLEPAMKERAGYLVVQTASIIEKIRRTKVPAAVAHDPDLEARIQSRFEFSFHASMPNAVFNRPSLIVSGRQDSIAGYDDAVAMLGMYPRATFALLDCAGHSLSWERPDLFKTLMLDWLERLETT